MSYITREYMGIISIASLYLHGPRQRRTQRREWLRFTREAAQKWALETTSLPRFAGKNAGN